MADSKSSKDDTSLSDLNLSMASSADISMVGPGHEDNVTFTEEHNDCRYFNNELRESLSTVKSLLKKHEEAAISAIMNSFFKDAVVEIVHSDKYLVGALKEKLKMKYYVLLIQEADECNKEQLGLEAMREKSTFTESEAKTVRDTIMKIVLEKCKTIKKINESFKSDLLPDTTVKPGNILSDDKINLMNEMDEWKVEKENFTENLEMCKEIVKAIEQHQSIKSKGITDKIEDINKHIGNLDIECGFLEHKVEVSANEDDNEESMKKALNKLIAIKNDEYNKKLYKLNKLTKKKNKYKMLMQDEEYVALQKEYDELMSELKKKRQILRTLPDN